MSAAPTVDGSSHAISLVTSSLVFPTVLGRGEPLFPTQAAPTELRLISAEGAGATVLLRYER